MLNDWSVQTMSGGSDTQGHMTRKKSDYGWVTWSCCNIVTKEEVPSDCGKYCARCCTSHSLCSRRNSQFIQSNNPPVLCRMDLIDAWEPSRHSLNEVRRSVPFSFLYVKWSPQSWSACCIACTRCEVGVSWNDAPSSRCLHATVIWSSLKVRSACTGNCAAPPSKLTLISSSTRRVDMYAGDVVRIEGSDHSTYVGWDPKKGL